MEQDGKWHYEYDKDGNLTERYIGSGNGLMGKRALEVSMERRRFAG